MFKQIAEFIFSLLLAGCILIGLLLTYGFEYAGCWVSKHTHLF